MPNRNNFIEVFDEIDVGDEIFVGDQPLKLILTLSHQHQSSSTFRIVTFLVPVLLKIDNFMKLEKRTAVMKKEIQFILNELTVRKNRIKISSVIIIIMRFDRRTPKVFYVI